MQPKNLPGSLPFLPGNVYQDPTITRYHKTQLLGVRDGAIQGKLRDPSHKVQCILYYVFAVDA